MAIPSGGNSAAAILSTGRPAAHFSTSLLLRAVDTCLSAAPRALNIPLLLAPCHLPCPAPCRSFAATELRLLRAAVGTFYDLLALATRAAEKFGGESPAA
jgi:hypothetical protein